MIGYFDWAKKDYKRIPVEEQVEVLSLLGDVAEAKGEPALHIHAVLGRSDGSVVGGHLLDPQALPERDVERQHSQRGVDEGIRELAGRHVPA